MDALVPVLVAATAWLGLRAGRGAAGAALLDATLAPAVGFGALSLAFFAWRLAGLGGASFGPFAWAGLLAVGGWGILALVRRGRSRGLASPDWRPVWCGPVWCRGLAVAAVCASLLALLGLAFLLYSRQAPVGQFDAWAIWTSRARLLFRTDDPLGAFAFLRRAHPDYPLLLPGALAGQFALVGRVTTAIPQWTGALFPLAGAAVLGVGVHLLGASARWSWVAAALLLSTPLWIDWGFAQCADVPLAYLAVAAALALALQVRDGPAAVLPPWLGGVLAGLPAWTKNEGMILSLLMLGLFGLWSAWRRRWGLVGRVALGAALPWGAVLAFRLAWRPRSDLGFFLDAPWSAALQLDRWRFVGASFGERLDPVGGFSAWGLAWPIAAAGIAIGLATATRRRPEIAFLLTLTACCWILWFGIFVATPHDVAWHVRTALDRLMLQLLPLTLLTAFAGAGLAARRPR